MAIIEGNEHQMFFRIITGGISEGIKRFAEDTVKRTDYLKSNESIFNAAILMSCSSYTEIELGKNWIDLAPHDLQEEFKVLRYIRNAWVHNGGNILGNLIWQTLDAEGQLGAVRSFIANFTGEGINNYLSIEEIDHTTTRVHLEQHSPVRMWVIFRLLFQHVGKIVHD